MESRELEKLIKSRRSTRKWQDRDVPEELLLRAVELATRAPNAGNQQNWRFYVITNRKVVQEIADSVQSVANLVASWPEAEKLGYTSRQRDNASFFRTAPAAIAVAASRYQSNVDQILEMREKFDPDAARIREWRNTADPRIQSIGSAIAYLTLVLHEMGIGAVWMTGPMQAKGEIEKLLRVPEGMDLVTFIPLGYPAETPSFRDRKPVGEIAEVVK